MDTIKKLRLLRLSVYVLAIFTVIFAFNYETIIRKTQPAVCGNEAVVFIDYEVDEVKYKEGRKLFKMLCSSCHKLDKDFIGPRLGAITERRDSNYLYAYIINQDSLIKLNPEINNVSIDSFKHQFNQLTKEQVDDILEYITY